RMLERLLGEDIELAVSLEPTSGQIRADRTQIEQVIMNLAVNARDAMPGGGRLAVETASVAVDEALASRHIGLTPGEHVLLTVSDNGCGMTAEVQAHPFRAFFHHQSARKGHRPWSFDCVRHYATTCRQDPGLQRVGEGNHLQAFLPHDPRVE